MFRPLRDRRFGSEKRSRAALSLLLLVVGGAFAVLVVVKTFAPVIALSILAFAIYYGRRLAKRQTDDYRRNTDITTLITISPIDFERHVASTYERLGYQVKLTPTTGDQGVDVIATWRDQRLGIQCKRYTGVVGNDAVQQAVAGRSFHGCSHAIVVTTGTFTPSARALAAKAAVQLVDGRAYSDMLNGLQKQQSTGFDLQDWIPRGRPRLIQGGLVLLALFVFAVMGSPIATLPDLGRAATQVVTERSNHNTQSLPPNNEPQATTHFDDRVLDFYSKLNARDFQDAYEMLSPSFRAGSTYAVWEAGYKTTESVQVEVTAIDEAAVKVSLLATDRGPNGPIVRRFQGGWSGIRGSDGEWYLNDGHFSLVTAAATSAVPPTNQSQQLTGSGVPEQQPQQQLAGPTAPNSAELTAAANEAVNELAVLSRSVNADLESINRLMTSDSGPTKIRSEYAAASSKMSEYWDKEEQAAAVTPMTCYQKSQVQYISTQVAYELSQIKYVDSEVTYVVQSAKPEVSETERDLSNYLKSASLFDQRFGASTSSGPDISASSLQGRVNAETSTTIAQLNALMQTKASYDKEGTDLTAKAKTFSDSLSCAG